MTAWARFLEGLLGLVGVVVGLFRERQARKDGAAEQVAETQKETAREVQVATEARSAVAGGLALHPDRVLDRDEFTRPD